MTRKYGRFDGRCPHCTAELLSLDNQWHNHHYSREFSMRCGECNGLITVLVHMQPDYELFRPVDLEE